MITSKPEKQNSRTSDKREKNRLFEERLKKYFTNVIYLCKKCKISPVSTRIIAQLIASAGSISANYAEASEAMSKKDFAKSIKISRKEAKESIVWLEGLKIAVDFKDIEFDKLIQETKEFVYIFTSILKKVA